MLALVACGPAPSGHVADANGDEPRDDARDDGGGGGDATPDAVTGVDASFTIDAPITSDASVPFDGPAGPCGATCGQFLNAVYGAALDVAVDAEDNVYVVGSLESDAMLGTRHHLRIGTRDAFIASFTASGVYRWSKTFGASGKLAGAYAVVVDHAGHIYIGGGVGTGGSGIDFGGGPIYASGQFLASFDANGNHRWSRIDGPAFGAPAIATSGSRVFTISRFVNTLQIGTLPPLTSAGYQDVVIASFSTSDGTPQWARRWGGPSSDYEQSIVAHDDWIVLTGNLGTEERLVSFTSSGGDRWDVLTAPSLDADGLDVDGSGNIYVTGRHRGGGDIVPGTPTSVDGDNVYIHSHTSAGATRWSWTLPEVPARDVNPIPATLVRVDRSGRPVVAGTFRGRIYAGGPALINTGYEDVFIAAFANDGTPVSARHPVDTTGFLFAHGVAVDSAGRVYVCGGYTGSPNFGDGPLPHASSVGPYLLRVEP